MATSWHRWPSSCLVAFLLGSTRAEHFFIPEAASALSVEGGFGDLYQLPEQLAESETSSHPNFDQKWQGSTVRDARRVLPGWDWEAEGHREEHDSGPEPPVASAEGLRGAPATSAEPILSLGEVFEQEEASRYRKLLNGLVAESVEKTDKQLCNVAFVKTHKTASTTLAMILVRYAKRHLKKLASFDGPFLSIVPLSEAARQVQASGQRVDVMHYHVNHGAWEGSWEDGIEKYQQIVQDTERVNYITVVRSPREHFLSYYYYYMQPENKLSIGQYLERRKIHPAEKLINPMCLEFGVHDNDQLDVFIEKHLPEFLLVIITAAFDEGLMTLRRLMGWDMIDMTYSTMMQTKKGAVRWDDKPLLDVPTFDSLPQWVQDTIDVNTVLDRKLYDAALRVYGEKRAEVDDIERDITEFKELQRIVSTYLANNASSKARKWYAPDAEPYKGGPPLYPF